MNKIPEGLIVLVAALAMAAVVVGLWAGCIDDRKPEAPVDAQMLKDLPPPASVCKGCWAALDLADQLDREGQDHMATHIRNAIMQTYSAEEFNRALNAQSGENKK